MLHYIGALTGAGFQVVVISASRLSASDAARLRTFAAEIILRDNVGLDFGSWAEGLAHCGDAIEGNLLLANDSVYGPIGDLSAALANLTSADADFYGMVESNEITPHLQSWFLLFKPHVHRHPEFRAFFRRSFAGLSKRDIIQAGEVGLSRRLCELGFRYYAVNSAWNATGVRRRIPANPSHFFWRELIEDGVPFLKAELLRDNPFKIASLEEWRSVVRARAPDLLPLIEEHQRALVGNAAARPRRDPYPLRLARAHQSFVRRELQFARSGRGALCALNWFAWRMLVEGTLRLRRFRPGKSA